MTKYIFDCIFPSVYCATRFPSTLVMSSHTHPWYPHWRTYVQVYIVPSLSTTSME